MNKYLVQIAALDWAKIVIIGIALAAGYFFLLYDNGSTVEAQIKQAQDRLAAAKKSLAETQTAVEHANAFEKEVQALQKRFDKITEYMPEKLTVNDLRIIVSKIAKEYQIKARFSPDPDTEPKGFYQVISADLELDGTYSAIASFLSAISREPRLLTFEKVSISPIQGSVPGSSGASLTFKGTISGYRYLKSAPDPDDAKPATPGAPAPAPATSPAAGA